MTIPPHIVLNHCKIMLCLSLLLLSGCGLHSLSGPSENTVVYSSARPQSFVFNTPRTVSPTQSYRSISQPHYYRAPWPVTEAPTGYVTLENSAIYSETTYDNQRIDGNNNPRQTYRNTSRTSKTIILGR